MPLSVKDILDTGHPLIELAAECRTEEDLRERVKLFLRKTQVARTIAGVMDAAGVKTDKEATAEVLFAYGSMALTAIAATKIGKLRADLIKSGHPDCSKGAPCPTTGQKCDKMACPFYEGLHPIRHMDAISAHESSEGGEEDMISFALGQSVAEA